MSRKLLVVIVPNETRLLPVKVRKIIALLALICLSACVPITQEPTVTEVPTQTKQTPATQKYSAKPIIRAKTIDVRFAQEALSAIGYKIGPVDGLWGPRSAAAIRQFESKQAILSANGHLSELSLHELAIVSGLTPKSTNGLPRKKVKQKTLSPPPGVSSKLDSKTPLSAGPQLIIVDHQYEVLSKPNPFSSTLFVLAPGTGIYVISKQGDYFEVESINRKRGYIRAD